MRPADPVVRLTEHPSAAPLVAALAGRIADAGAHAEPEGAVIAADAADALPAIRAALAAGQVAIVCGRPADLDPLTAAAREGEGLLLVVDPPWLLVAGAEPRAETIAGWPAAAQLALAALGARRSPALSAALGPRPPRFPDAFVHPTAVVDGDVRLGPGTKVWHFAKLLGPCAVGAGCSLGQNVVVERDVRIGDNVRIQNNVSVYSGVVLEDDVFCGPSMVFTNVGTPRSHYPRKGEYAVTRVGRGASIGANATVVCGTTLGAYSFVGAGAVVTRDVPPHGLVYGNPARLRGWACYCGARLPLGVDPEAGPERARCGTCARRYARTGRVIQEER